MKIGVNIAELQRRVAFYDDEPAYKEIFFTYYPRLVRFASSFLSSRESAEEIVSDVFMKMWEKRKTLDSIENLRLYLYICTKNSALNYLAKNNKHSVVGIDDLTVELSSESINPEQLMITAEMMKRINQAINSLPPRCKLIFKLVKEDGLRYKEISALLHISVKTVDNQLAIALRKISMAVSVNMMANVQN
jgi:RNA polymerase sigma-70 factor (family 1)